MRRPERSVADRIHDAEESYRRAPIMNARRAEPDPEVFFASLPTGTALEISGVALCKKTAKFMGWGVPGAPTIRFGVRRLTK